MVANVPSMGLITPSHFISWEGGDPPLPADTQVLVIYRKMNGDQAVFKNGRVSEFNWAHDSNNPDDDILAYRVQPIPLDTFATVAPQ